MTDVPGPPESWGPAVVLGPQDAEDLALVEVEPASPLHLAFVAGRACFTGDAVLGRGSVFVTGRLAEYLAALERLRALHLAVLCPGHGPPVWDPAAKLAEYVAHRGEREQKLLAALDAGLRTHDELLDAAWADAPPGLREAAAMTLEAHLGKLREEGRLPAGL